MADGQHLKTGFDVDAIRAEFPILQRDVNGAPLCYLDNAASAQKPAAVIDAFAEQMRTSYANVHRGLHTLANETTATLEASRETVRAFLNADRVEEIVFTKGATEAINLVASGIGSRLQPGDEIILSVMEHHSNIVPWHFLRERCGAVIKWVPLLEDGSLDMAALARHDRSAYEVRFIDPHVQCSWHGDRCGADRDACTFRGCRGACWTGVRRLFIFRSMSLHSTVITMFSRATSCTVRPV